MEHTPTPWKVNPDNPTEIWFGENEDCLVGADVYYREGLQQATVDAAFVVLAVNNHEAMRDALAGMVEAYKDRCDDKDQPTMVKQAVQVLRQVGVK